MRKLIWALLLICGAAHAEGDVLASGGITYLRGQTEAASVYYQDDLAKVKYFGDIKYEVGLMYIADSNQWDRYQPDKWTAVGRFIKEYKQIEFGIGLSYSTDIDEYNGSRLNFTEVLRLNFEKGWYLEVSHISNAGIVKPNLGRDTLQVGRKF